MKSFFPRRLVPASCLALLYVLFSVFLAPPVEAGRKVPIIPNVEIGTSARSVAKAVNTKFKCFGEHRDFKAWYKSCDPAERKGCRLLLTAAREHGDKAPDMMRMMRDLRDIEKQFLHLPSHHQPMTLKKLCREIGELEAFAVSKGGDNKKRLTKTLHGIMTRVKTTGVVTKIQNAPQTHIRGGVGEILELNRAQKAGVIQEIAPPRNFREARCEGGTMPGPWYLEVKNWPFYGVAKGLLGPVASLKTQIYSHLRNTPEIVTGLKNVTKSLDEIPGICYRFLRAGPDDGFFGTYLTLIQSQFTHILYQQAVRGDPAIANNPELRKIILDRIGEFVEKRVFVELAKDVP